MRLVQEKLVANADREKENCERVEDDLRTAADALRKQLKDETHSRTVLKVIYICTILCLSVCSLCTLKPVDGSGSNFACRLLTT